MLFLDGILVLFGRAFGILAEYYILRYVLLAVQIPRFAFEKFPGAKAELTTQMKSVGEAMAMGRTFQESFQKVRAFSTTCTSSSPGNLQTTCCLLQQPTRESCAEPLTEKNLSCCS